MTSSLRTAFASLSLAALASLAFACANGPNGGSSLPDSSGITTTACSKDADCKGDRLCQKGQCVDAEGDDDGDGPVVVGKGGGSGTGGKGGASGTGGTGGTGGSPSTPPSPPPAPVCKDPGETCDANGDCCDSGSGVGQNGQFCISDTGTCHAACSSNAECNSGCCAPVKGSSLGVCAAASNCAPTCASPGSACSTPADCCQNDSTKAPYGQTCMSDDYTCHAICTDSDQCTSGCCIKLSGKTYGACGQYKSNLTCL